MVMLGGALIVLGAALIGIGLVRGGNSGEYLSDFDSEDRRRRMIGAERDQHERFGW